eukprot:1891598-Heterocapsa_arctica.AAC.1
MAQEGPRRGQASPPAQDPGRPVPGLESWDQEAGEKELDRLKKRLDARREAKVAREKQEASPGPHEGPRTEGESEEGTGR